MIVIICPRDIILSSSTIILRAKWVILQKRNKIVRPLKRADIVLTITATLEGSEANCVNKLAVNMKKGAPGGWPTSNLYAEEINSPQSQKLAVGSIVIR